MKFGQTITAVAPTKSGPVEIVVNVIVTGPRDGAAAVLTDLAAHVMAAQRLAGAVLSPPVELHDDVTSVVTNDGIYYAVADDDGMPGDSRECRHNWCPYGMSGKTEVCCRCDAVRDAVSHQPVPNPR